MQCNRLKLNTDKTQLIWMGDNQPSRQPANQPTILLYKSISARPTQKATQFVSLRMCRTWVCSWSAQDRCRITSLYALCRTCFFQLCQIRSIRRSLTLDAKKTLVNAFVASRLDCCNSLHHGIGEGLRTRQIAVSAKCGGKTHPLSSEIRPQ